MPTASEHHARPHSCLRHFLYRLRTDRRACRPSFCGTGLLAQPEATGRSRCLAKSSLVTQRWRYLLCHSGKLRTVVWAASTTKNSSIETRKGEQTAQACANAWSRQLSCILVRGEAVLQEAVANRDGGSYAYAHK